MRPVRKKDDFNQVMSALRIALISPEISPFAKTGGLADMAASLGSALKETGHEPIFFLPKYRELGGEEFPTNGKTLQISLGKKNYPFRIGQGKGPQGIPIYVVDLPGFFDRKGLYGEGGKDYSDNCLRFAAFCMAVLQGLKELQISADILHVHDWQTALIPVYLKTLYAQDPFFQKTRTVLTLHNLGYQGIFPPEDFSSMGLEQGYFSPHFLEFHHRINLLKGGILAADALTTVSPSYAREILTPEWGFGLEGVLKQREGNLYGIINGIEAREWDPPFSPEDLSGKWECKQSLQKELNLPIKREVPVFAVISRLVDQKGIDLVLELIPSFRHGQAQWVILGTGDLRMEQELLRLAEIYPEQVAVKIGFDSALAHRITAGADFILMPSRYEPCGYNQMYGMRYGSVPVVRATGGLKDTVRDIDDSLHEGVGIVFLEASTQGLQEAIFRAFRLYENQNDLAALRARMMRLNFSWGKSSEAYLGLYKGLLTAPVNPLPKIVD